MSGEVLREAARLMRKRASDAYSAIDDGDWRFDNTGWYEGLDTTYTVENDTMKVCEAVLEEPAVHIASWHPAIAFYVAALLDSEADRETYSLAEFGHRTASRECVTLARAYLGMTP